MKTFLIYALVLLFTAPLARAEDVLEIPEQCGSRTELEREIDALQASNVARRALPRPDVQLRPDGDAYMLEIALPEGRRLLRDSDCRALFRAAIVIAALGLEGSAESVLRAADAARAEPARPEPGRGVSKPPDERSTQSVRATSDPAARTSGVRRATMRAMIRSTPSDDAPSARTRVMRVLLRADAAYGPTPGVSALVGAGLALEYARFSGRLLLGYQTPSTHRAGSEGVRVDALSAALSVELVLLSWLRAGVGADFFALRGRGLGGGATRTGWATEPTLHAGLSFRVLALGPVWLELCGRVLWAPEPVSFLFRGRSAVYRTPSFAGQGGIVASYQFL